MTFWLHLIALRLGLPSLGGAQLQVGPGAPFPEQRDVFTIGSSGADGRTHFAPRSTPVNTTRTHSQAKLTSHLSTREHNPRAPFAVRTYFEELISKMYPEASYTFQAQSLDCQVLRCSQAVDYLKTKA